MVVPTSVEENKLAGQRLHAARLVAGHVAIEEASRLLGVPSSTLRTAEAGRRAAHAGIIKSAAETYRVRPEFLELAPAEGEREKIVEAIVSVLRNEKFSNLTDERKNWISARLRDYRRRLGIRSASKAAQEFGWKKASYVAYEGNSKKISMDRVVVYALALAKPEHILEFFELQDSSRKKNTQTANDRTATSSGMSAPSVPPDDRPSPAEMSSSWPAWLLRPFTGEALVLPVIAGGYGRMERLSGEVFLPGFMADPSWEQKRGLFAIPVSGKERALTVLEYVHDLTQVDERCLVFDGRDIHAAERSMDLQTGDPLQPAQQRPILLGRVLGVLGMHMARR